MFTRDQIEEIKKKLVAFGTKDTQLLDAHKLDGNEIVAIVQDGENRKIPLSSIIGLLSDISVTPNDDFINVSKDTTGFLTLSTAVSKVDINNRKLGQVITFKDSANSWAIRQFTGSSLDNWHDISLWKSISGIDELKSQVESNAEDISVLSGEIDRHDASILNLSTDVSKLKDKDTETSSSLSGLTTRVDTLKSQADTNTNNISSLNTEVSTLQSKVDVNTTSISKNKVAIEKNTSDIKNVSDTVDAQAAKLNDVDTTLENALFKNKGYFTTLEKLNEAIPNPTIGSKAYVGTSEPYAIYIVENGVWVDSGYTGGDEIVAKITTDRIEDGAVTTEKIATSAFDSTLSVSGKIAPADMVGERLTDLESKISLSFNDFLASGFISQTAAGIYYDSSIGVFKASQSWNGFLVYLRPGIKLFLVKGGIYRYAHYFNDYPNIKDKALGEATIDSANADGLVKISIPSNDNGCYVLVTMHTKDQKVSDSSVISSEIYLTNKSLDDKIGGYEEKINGRWNRGGAILIDGTIITGSGYGPWSYTDPIPVNRGDIVIVNCAGSITKISAIASSDANGENIKNIKSTIPNQVVYYFVNDEEYIRCTTRFDKGGYARIYKGGVISEAIVLVNKHDSDINKLKETITKSSKTDGIVEPGSELTQDNVNLLSERSHKLNVTNTNAPVVAFIFDDNYVQSYVDLFNERGLKLTFAIIGNVNKSKWATTGNAIRKQVLNGHGTCAHGVVRGVSVTGSGVDTMNDADVKIATEGENKAFDDYKLSHRGLVQYNTWQDNPHTWALMGRYYDYIVGFDNEKCINTPPTTDLYQLRRMWTDNPNMLDAQKAKVDAAIAKGDCLLIFGGHFARTGQGGTYSTMEEFVALLDYVAEKVSAGQMLSLNMDDAVDMLWGRAIAHNVVMASDYENRNPMKNSMKIKNGLKICTNVGTKAIYSMSITGTTVAGAFTINLGNASKTTNVASCQSVTINTTAGESITSVISKIVSSIYKAYTVRSFNDGEVVLYRDINGVTFTPYITNNTSELAFSIVQITEGTEAVWE